MSVFSVCSAQGVSCSVVHSPSILFSVCSVQSTHWLFTKSVMFMFRVCSLNVLCPCAVLNIPSTTEGHLKTKYNVNKYIKKSTDLSMRNDTFWYVCIFGRNSLGGTYLSALGSQQEILISASTVSHCGSHVWKKWSCSEHQYIGLLEEHCSNYIMSMLNLQTNLLGASSRQHDCGIKQNNELSESVLPSVMPWMSDNICMYIRLLV